ncbi:hypothetical protein SCALM49S_08098 [Streptomyces californicus]
MSASVSSRKSGFSRRATAIPCRSAQSLPVQPRSGSPGVTTVSGSPPYRVASSRASRPVPSLLQSSTRMIRASPG